MGSAPAARSAAAFFSALVFLTVFIYGIYKNGLKFFKLFVPHGIPIYILPLIMVIEVISFLSQREIPVCAHLGLTPPGQSWQAVESGAIEPGGRCPVNMSGGLIGGGHPVGATGVRMTLDAYKQVTGKAGDYQVQAFLHSSLNQAMQAFAPLDQNILLIALAALLASLSGALLLARNVSQPVRELALRVTD